MFREQFKKDLDGISPDEELLNKVTKSMQEEAAKPRQPKHIAMMRFGGMAAAVCMIAVGSAVFYGTDGVPAAEAADEYSITADESEVCEVCDAEGTEAFLDNIGAAAGAEETPVEMQNDKSIAMEETADDIEKQSSEAPDAEENTQEGILYEEKKIITLPDFENRGAYADGDMNSAVTGISLSYGEIMNGRTDDTDSLYRIAITGVLTKEQAAMLGGYDVDIDEGATFYNAEIQLDYISGEEMSEDIILRLSGDNLYNTEYGNPCYAEGDIIAVVLQKEDENEEFRRRFSFAFAYDVYEIEDKDYFAVRNQNIPEVTEGLTDYFDGRLVSYETTTPSNPAVYYGLYEAEGVAENLRGLWGDKNNDEEEAVYAASYINSISAYYMDREAYIDGTEHFEIISTVFDYTKNNPHKITYPVFTSANIDSFAKYGLSLCYENDKGDRIRVLIDSLRAYVQVKGSYYIFEGEAKDSVMSHFGEAQLAVQFSDVEYKGNKLLLSEEKAYEIWNILYDYAESNPDKSLDTEYMKVDFDSVCQDGLYFYVRGYRGEKAFIYIDSNISYAVVDRNYYIFEGKHRDRVLEYFSEYGTIENMYVTPKILADSRVLYKGTSYTVTLDEISEIDKTVSDYTEKNTHRITSRVLTGEEIEEYEESGLALTLVYNDGSEIHIYADEENAFICGENTYLLGSNVHAQVIAYAEAVKLKKALGM